MKRWFSGAELLKRWGIKHFELVEFIKQGLQPYTQHGKKVLNEDARPKARRFSIEEMEKHIRAQENAGRVLGGKGPIRPPMTDKEIYWEAQIAYNRQPLEVLERPQDCLVMSFKVPVNKQKASELFDKISLFLFKEYDVLVFENDNNLHAEEPQNKHEEATKEVKPDKSKSTLLTKNNFIHRKGDLWTVCYKSKQAVLPHSVGMTYIVFLLSNPETAFHANKLVALIHGPILQERKTSDDAMNCGGSSIQKKMSDNDLKVLKEKLFDLHEMSKNAAAIEKREEAEEDYKKLEEFLKKDGYKVSIRNSGVSIKEIPGRAAFREEAAARNSNSVSMAITRALKKYQTYHEEFAMHLRNQIKKGSSFSYNDAETIWDIVG